MEAATEMVLPSSRQELLLTGSETSASYVYQIKNLWKKEKDNRFGHQRL